MSEKPIKVLWDESSNRFYASNRYKIKDGIVTITGKKYDVTNDIVGALFKYELEIKDKK